jgi:hypothetical protein
MMYFDSDIHMTMECTYSWCYFGFIHCYLLYVYEKLCKFVYNGLDSHDCT